MLETLPQWMQDVWPYMIWWGGFGVVWGLWWDALRRFKKWRDHKKSAEGD